MKKLILAALVALSFAGLCQAQSGNAPYTAQYSSNFTIGDPSYSAKILALWKDYENNTLDNHLDWFADTVTMTLATGQTVKGKAENLAGVKQFRGSIKDYKVALDAWVSLKSTDRQQNVVCIWGDENYTDKDGKHVSARIHEVWAFNNEGKIAFMLQFSGLGGM